MVASVTTAGIGLGSASQVTTLTGPLLCYAPNDATAGVNPCIALRWFPADTALATFRYEMRGATASGSPSVRPTRNLYLTDAYAAGYPIAANVRTATTYGPGSIYTGTCAVPAAASVVVGTAVDATVGTAAVTAASIRTALGLASANLDTQLSAIPTAAAPSASTIASAVWSAATRTITTTIPTAAEIATAVWAAATRTLTTAIDNSTTIATAVWGYASGRTITGGTVDTLTNAPTVPSAATIAAATRTELATELARIDVATSTRLAPSGTLARVTLADTTTTLTNAPSVPSAATIASQVRTELTPELDRVANCATVESTGDQIVALIP